MNFGNNLGSIDTRMYANSSPVREDGERKLYLDMNLTITPQFQPSKPVDIRVYIKNTEYNSLKRAVNSVGQSSGINSINDIAIYKNPDNSCLPAIHALADTVPTKGALWQNDYVLSASIASFSSFYFANRNYKALPLTLLEFNGHLQNKNGLLNWKTENEYNVAGFEIERSTDGNNFTVIGAAVSTGLPGVHSYSFTDIKTSLLDKAIVYYRLKQKETDGSFTYTRIVIISIDKNNSCLLFPNPVSGKATLIITLGKAQRVNARIIDNTGKPVKLFQWNLTEGSTSILIDNTSLAKGLYYLELQGPTISEHKQFTKQ